MKRWHEVYFDGKVRKAKWRVVFPDGTHTRPLLKADARARAKLHKGELVKIIYPMEPEGGKP